jgi:hypothetical protein
LRSRQLAIRSLTVAGLLAIAAHGGVYAQTSREDPTDFQTRYGAGLDVDLPNGWEAGLKYQLRLVDNSSLYRGSYLYAEVAKSLGDYLAVLAEYRLALVDDGTFHRYALGLDASTEIWDTDVSFRPIFQYQMEASPSDDDQSSDDDAILRARLKGEKALGDRVELYGSVEPYIRFGADYLIDNWRNTLGLQLEFMRDRKIDLYYSYRPDYAKSYNRTFHIVGVELQVAVDPF